MPSNTDGEQPTSRRRSPKDAAHICTQHLRRHARSKDCIHVVLFTRLDITAVRMRPGAKTVVEQGGKRSIVPMPISIFCEMRAGRQIQASSLTAAGWTVRRQCPFSDRRLPSNDVQSHARWRGLAALCNGA